MLVYLYSVAVGASISLLCNHGKHPLQEEALFTETKHAFYRGLHISPLCMLNDHTTHIALILGNIGAGGCGIRHGQRGVQALTYIR